MTTELIFRLLVGVSVAAASAYLGTFMVLKRMSLVGDALSHVALPGMALALLFHFSPLAGAFLALIVGVLLIWYLGENTRVYPEALVGVLFTGSLAVGLLITPAPDLLEALFGDIQKITYTEGIIAILLSLVIIFVTSLISKKLILGIVSEDLAKVSGVNSSLINLIYLLMIGAVVALGVRFVGTILTGALVIVPAAAAKNISNKIFTYYGVAIFMGVVSAGSGILISNQFHLATGPLVVISTIAFFILSFLFKTKAVQEKSAN